MTSYRQHDIQEEYLSKLQSLFRRVPRARQLLSKNADTTSLYLKSLKDILDKDSIGSNGKPLQSAPSFAFAEELGAIRSNPHQFQTTSLSAHRSASNTAQVLAGEVVISFTLHSGSQRSQDIDMLGSQTLRDLQDAICHGLKEKYVNEVESNTKSRSDCFFFIEGYFYADDVSPPSQQPHTSWRADSAERLHKIRRWLLHGNQDATASSQNAALVGEECSVEGEVFEEVEVEEEEEDIMEGTVETSLASNQRLKLAAVKDRHKKFAAAPAPAPAAPVAPAPAAPGSRRRKTSRHDPSPVVGKAKINQNTISSKGVKRKTPVTSTARKGPITKKASSVSFIDPNSDSDGSSSDYEKHGSNSDAQIGQKTTIQRGLVKRSIGPTSAGGSASSSSALNSQPLTLGPYNRALRNCTGNVMNSGSSASDSNSNSRSDIRESRLELNGLSASSALTILSLDTTIGSLLLRSGVRYLYNHSGSTSGDREYFLYVTDMHLHSSIRGSTNKSDGAKDKPVFHRDLPLISSYPRQTFQVRTVVKKCAICLLWSAQYVVYGDRLADRSPMLYCQYVM